MYVIIVDSLLGVSSPIHSGVSAQAKGEDGISVFRHPDLCKAKPPGKNGECQVSYRWSVEGKVRRKGRSGGREAGKIGKRIGIKF